MLEPGARRPPRFPAEQPKSGRRISRSFASQKRRRRAFGMGDAPPGHHPVDGPRTDDLARAETIPVMDLAAIKVGDGREADVRVRTNAVCRSGDFLQRPKLIKKDERPNHLALRRRKHPTDERIDVDRTRARSAVSIDFPPDGVGGVRLRQRDLAHDALPRIPKAFVVNYRRCSARWPTSASADQARTCRRFSQAVDPLLDVTARSRPPSVSFENHRAN